MDEDFISADTLAKLRKAAASYPETEHAYAGGWCKHCGCGNDVLGHRHLMNCNRPRDVSSSLTDSEG